MLLWYSFYVIFNCEIIAVCTRVNCINKQNKQTIWQYIAYSCTCWDLCGLGRGAWTPAGERTGAPICGGVTLDDARPCRSMITHGYHNKYDDRITERESHARLFAFHRTTRLCTVRVCLAFSSVRPSATKPKHRLNTAERSMQLKWYGKLDCLLGGWRHPKPLCLRTVCHACLERIKCATCGRTSVCWVCGMKTGQHSAERGIYARQCMYGGLWGGRVREQLKMHTLSHTGNIYCLSYTKRVCDKKQVFCGWTRIVVAQTGVCEPYNMQFGVSAEFRYRFGVEQALCFLSPRMQH